jgi:hypothetical protein
LPILNISEDFKGETVRTVNDPVELIQKTLDQWDIPYVEQDIFDTDDARRIAATVNAFCEKHLHAKVAGYLFHTASVGSTHGVRLEDGREVVIKARPPAGENRYLDLGRKKVETIFRVMTWLHDRGYPCPGPLLGPNPIGKGLATVEEYLERGERGNGFLPECRKVIASGLADLIGLLRKCDIEGDGLRNTIKAGSLYPQPHGKIFNFEATARGSEWIDAFARRSRSVSLDKMTCVIGHADWRAEHLRFGKGKIAAVYDWDALTFRPEPEIVGVSAHGFTADWSRPDVRRIPTGDDIRAYIAAYEEKRGAPFSKKERQAVFASCVYWISYGARCQHSLHPGKAEWEADTFPYLLLTDGEALLAEAI